MDTLNRDYDLENLTSDMENFKLIILPKGPEEETMSFIERLIKKFAVEQKTPILFFSLERSKEQFGINFFYAHSKINPNDLGGQNWKKTCEIANIISNAPLFIEDNPDLTIKDILSKTKRLKENKNLGLIIIDNFYLIKSFNHPKDQDTIETTVIEDELKKLTKKFQVPIITFYPAK